MDRLSALLVGVVMGALLQRVRASDPGVIARNLRLEDLSIIKFMATAIAVGAVIVSLAGLVLPLHLDIKPAYLVGVLGGGLVFGVGFALGGFCPGTCVVGLAEGRRDAPWALVGGIAGALVFTLLYELVVAPLLPLLNVGKVTLADLVHLPAPLVAGAMAVVILAVVARLPTVRGQRRSS
ncbi:MAG TPA: YeeE/YedE thiosulfate transporter family protein [Myxococcaceae bacterium]|nr:YeeE/YedE thiosulfate transporter family protein [Myxococcaceae bacterium]